MRELKSVTLESVTKMFTMRSGKGIVRAVDNISVKIKAGEFVTLLGPSGCGKTTTLRMIAGFEIPTAGDVSIGDKIINDLTPDKRDTSMVFQSYALFPHIDVFDNIAYGLKIKKLNKVEIEKKVIDILKLVGLNGFEDRRINQLSGGQQQRIALARALVTEPEVLLFDEPLSNLDAKLRIHMRVEIKKIQRRVGTTSIYVTHDQVEAMSLSDRIIVMNEGCIEQIGIPQEVYQQPASEFVANFIGTANFVDGVIKEADYKSADVEILGQVVKIPIRNDKKFLKGDKVKVVIRPEAVKLGREGKFEGKVVMSAFMGSTQEYKLDINGVKIDTEELNYLGNEVFGENQSVKVNFLEDSLHIIKEQKKK